MLLQMQMPLQMALQIQYRCKNRCIYLPDAPTIPGKVAEANTKANTIAGADTVVETTADTIVDAKSDADTIGEAGARDLTTPEPCHLPPQSPLACLCSLLSQPLPLVLTVPALLLPPQRAEELRARAERQDASCKTTC